MPIFFCSDSASANNCLREIGGGAGQEGKVERRGRSQSQNGEDRVW